MKWPVKQPPWLETRNVWRFSWLPTKVRLHEPHKNIDEMTEYWVWLEFYHSEQQFNGHANWVEVNAFTYTDNKKVVLK